MFLALDISPFSDSLNRSRPFLQMSYWPNWQGNLLNRCRNTSRVPAELRKLSPCHHSIRHQGPGQLQNKARPTHSTKHPAIESVAQNAASGRAYQTWFRRMQTHEAELRSDPELPFSHS